MSTSPSFPPKPINTTYNGFQFRSRLEARWGVFFDALGIPWQYEKEGYDLQGVYYLPDFWLPDQDCWVEIKPTAPTAEEVEKASRLAQATSKYVYLFFGDLEQQAFATQQNGICYLGSWQVGGKTSPDASAIRFDPHPSDWHYWWCECPVCGSLGISFEGRAARLPCGCLRRNDPYEDKGHNPTSVRLVAAYEKARRRRFWR